MRTAIRELSLSMKHDRALDGVGPDLLVQARQRLAVPIMDDCQFGVGDDRVSHPLSPKRCGERSKYRNEFKGPAFPAQLA